MSSSKTSLPVPRDEFEAALNSFRSTLQQHAETHRNGISPLHLQNLTSLLLASFENIDNFTLEPMDYNLYKKQFIKYDTPMKEKLGVCIPTFTTSEEEELDDDEYSTSDTGDDSSVDTILEEEDLIDEEVWQRARLLRQQVRDAARSTAEARAEQLKRLDGIVNRLTECSNRIDEQLVEQLLKDVKSSEAEDNLSTVVLEPLKFSLVTLKGLLNAMDIDLPNRFEDLKENVQQAENILKEHRGETVLPATEKALQMKMGGGMKSLVKVVGDASNDESLDQENEINGVKKSVESRFASFISRN